MKRISERFWAWYERHYTLNVGIAAGLFLLQLAHLYWLTADVVMLRLIGESFFELGGYGELIITLVDYTEIPAIVGVSLVYINELRKRIAFKSILYLLLLNSQWLHIFWITDEFVIASLTGAGAGTVLPLWLAWTAILIDYLELPVMYDTIKQFAVALRQKRFKKALETFREA